MAPKTSASGKSGVKSSKGKSKTEPASTSGMQTDLLESVDDSFISPRCVSLSLFMKGDAPGPGDCNLMAVFNSLVLVEGRWTNGGILEASSLPLNLKDPEFQDLVANRPLILLIRPVSAKSIKDPDPLAHPDNRAGASVDLFPLLLGEEEIFVKSRLVAIHTGEYIGCKVQVRAVSPGPVSEIVVPLIITMLSVHCMPLAKEGTYYMSAIGLNGVHTPPAVNFNLSLSSETAEKVVFATASHGDFIANTAMNILYDDKFIPEDLIPRNNSTCRSFYWNAMRRVLVNPDELLARLSSPFMIEVAGLPRVGKEVRGRYMGFVDAKVLQEPGQITVTVCSKLLFYNEANIPENSGPLLELSPLSAKASNRETEYLYDENGHNTYAIIRFDLVEGLVPKPKLATLYETIGFPTAEGVDAPIDVLESQPAAVDPIIDAKRVRKEGGALAVHKELSGLACKGMVPMNQGIKRTAANRLLMRVRAMLKSFPPGECSPLDWKDTVTGQHAAGRRAVTASFAPQPPPLRLPDKVAAARSRIARDTRIADRHIMTNLKVAGSHPRSLMSKALRCLEARNDMDAKNYLLEALRAQSRNRYLLWMLGGLEFDQRNENAEVARAALHIAVKGDYADGTANAIGYAAMHAFHHYNGNPYAAFVAAKKMRKAFSLHVEWDKILERWTQSSGEEEIYWIPSVIIPDNPMLIAAAFFLCLRCYKFSERLLQCVERDCAGRGTDSAKYNITMDVYYLRAASLILRRQVDSAMEVTDDGIRIFGPSPVMSQMRATCLSCLRNWDRDCEIALREAEKAGSQVGPALLHTASLASFKYDPEGALQRAARAHKQSPSGYTALLIGRIYAKMGDEWLAERWLAAAVKAEPLLSDAWAMLALLAMYDKNLDKARVMLRTARQAGPLSPDIEAEVKKLMNIVELDQLPDLLVKNLCLCDFY